MLIIEIEQMKYDIFELKEYLSKIEVNLVNISDNDLL